VALLWPATLAVTSTVLRPAGLVAVQLVLEAQATAVAGVAPKESAVCPAAVLKPLPETVTLVPPVFGPLAGLTPVTVGRKAKASAAVKADRALATTTLTAAAVGVLLAGMVALHCVVLPQLTPVAVVLPKETCVAPAVVLKPVPVMVTDAAAPTGAVAGLTPVTAGR
jgi:hypothetical protein